LFLPSESVLNSAMSCRRLIAIAAFTAVLTPATASPAPPARDGVTSAASKKAKAIRRATARLSGKRYTRFTQSGMTSFDQRLHLCADKHFIYDTVSSTEGGITPPDVRRVEGRWRVTSASINGRVWKARVRGTPSDGSPVIVVKFRTNGRRTTIDGNAVTVERSDLC
jgi:hypothetical protein